MAMRFATIGSLDPAQALPEMRAIFSKVHVSVLTVQERELYTNIIRGLHDTLSRMLAKYREIFPLGGNGLQAALTLYRLSWAPHRELFPETKQPEETVEDALTGLIRSSTESAFRRLYESTLPPNVTERDGPSHLLALVDAIIEEMHQDVTYMQPIFGDTPVADISLTDFLSRLTTQLTTCLSLHGAVDQMEPGKPLHTLYLRLLELREMFAAPDNAFQPAMDGFAPVLVSWVAHTESQLRVYMERLVRAESWYAGDTPYSTSVTDLFAAFHQQLQFLQTLQWPEPLFYGHLMTIYAEAVYTISKEYASHLKKAAFGLEDRRRKRMAEQDQATGPIATITSSLSSGNRASTSRATQGDDHEVALMAIFLNNAVAVMRHLRDFRKAMNMEDLLETEKQSAADAMHTSRKGSHTSYTPALEKAEAECLQEIQKISAQPITYALLGSVSRMRPSQR